MKVPVQWLREFIALEGPISDTVARLTLAGLEVEGVHTPSPLDATLITARIVDLRPHPRADRLTLCSVEVAGDVRQVVCGARNMKLWDVVVLAQLGTCLPDGRKIEPVKLRGERSEGMLCSGLELGISEEHEGIQILPPTTPLGVPFSQVYSGSDTVLEVSITPNRSDCLSILGIARDLAALTGRALLTNAPHFSRAITDDRKAPGSVFQASEALPVAASSAGGATSTSEPARAPAAAAAPARLDVQVPELCPTYLGLVLEQVKVGPSPQWLVTRLNSAGLRSINNVVDATNYVMLERGQPLHAFDLDRLRGQQIVVRTARAGEHMLCLDGVDRHFDARDLLICDREGPVALAGVMGGEDSAVAPTTTRLLLEAARFDPSSVRTSARRGGLHTDASHRFERGVDPEGVEPALEALARLILRVAGGRVAGPPLRAERPQPPRTPIMLDPVRTRGLLGFDVPAQRMVEHLQRLNMQVTPEAAGGSYQVLAPSYRLDIQLPADLAEEIARLEGYEFIPSTAPLAPMKSPTMTARRSMVRRLTDHLQQSGLDQAVNFTFISPQLLEALKLPTEDQRARPLRLVNPLSEEISLLRPLLLPSLIKAAAHNIRRESPDLRLFELGKVFLPQEGSPRPLERYHLAILLTGQRFAKEWGAVQAEVDLHDLKGVLEELCERAGVTGLTVAQELTQPFLAPGQGATLLLGGHPIGYFGELHPETARAVGFEQRALVLELEVEPFWAARKGTVRFQPLPRYPSVYRDLALVVAEHVTAAQIEGIVREQAAALLEHFVIFDLYRGRGVEPGQKSIACRMVLRSSERTLVDEEVQTLHQHIVASLERRLGAQLRG